MVQQLHGVQFWAVAGQEVQLNALGMAANPGADQLGPMHRMAVHDQVHPPATAIAQQPAQEIDEHRSVERAHNSWNRSSPALEMALIMLTRNRLPVRLMTGVWPTGAQERPAAASERTPISSSHTPALPAGLRPDGGIGLGQPAAHRGRVLLQGAVLGPLGLNPQPRRYPPTVVRASHSP